MEKKKSNKAIWIGGVIGGLYALIPSLIIILDIINTTYLGDKFSWLLFPKWNYSGEVWPFLIPIFWPAGISYIFLVIVSYYVGFSLLANNTNLGIIILLFVNIIFWIIIGTFILGLIKKSKRKNR